jgi:hypothetical protein
LIDNLDADIPCALRHSPFATVRSVSEEVNFWYETVRRRLTESLQLGPRFLKCVPHFLTHDLNRKRVEPAKELFEILHFEERTLFHRIIAVDKSWLYPDYSSDHIWTSIAHDVPQRVSHQIQSEKVILTVLWSTRGTILVKWMERSHQFNTTYFINEIISDLVANFKATGKFPDMKC